MKEFRGEILSVDEVGYAKT